MRRQQWCYQPTRVRIWGADSRPQERQDDSQSPLSVGAHVKGLARAEHAERVFLGVVGHVSADAILTS